MHTKSVLILLLTVCFFFPVVLAEIAGRSCSLEDLAGLWRSQMRILQLAAPSSSGSQTCHRAIPCQNTVLGFWKGASAERRFINELPALLPPSVYLGVTKYLRVRTVCASNFKKKESWGAWYWRTAQLSQIVVRWLCLCPQENLQTKANYPSPHLRWTACLCICIPTRPCGHPPSVPNYTLSIVNNKGLVTR